MPFFIAFFLLQQLKKEITSKSVNTGNQETYSIYPYFFIFLPTVIKYPSAEAKLFE